MLPGPRGCPLGPQAMEGFPSQKEMERWPGVPGSHLAWVLSQLCLACSKRLWELGQVTSPLCFHLGQEPSPQTLRTLECSLRARLQTCPGQALRKLSKEGRILEEEIGQNRTRGTLGSSQKGYLCVCWSQEGGRGWERTKPGQLACGPSSATFTLGAVGNSGLWSRALAYEIGHLLLGQL